MGCIGTPRVGSQWDDTVVPGVQTTMQCMAREIWPDDGYWATFPLRRDPTVDLDWEGARLQHPGATVTRLEVGAEANGSDGLQRTWTFWLAPLAKGGPVTVGP